MTDHEVRVFPTQYTVTAYPGGEDDINAISFELTVEYRGEGRWAVKKLSACLGADGTWDYESMPSERADEWLRGHRFDLDTALALARREAPNVRLNGASIDDVLAFVAERRKSS